MKIYKVGDSVKAICDGCKAMVNATFRVRDVPFDDGSGIVKNIMAGVCEKCGEVIVIPPQSTPAIKEQIDKQKKPVEGRIPAHMVDILNLAAVEVGASKGDVQVLVKYFIRHLAENGKEAAKIASLLESDLAKGPADKRLSLKGANILADIELLKSLSNIPTTTELLKGVILKINDDVIQNKSPSIKYELAKVVHAVA
jgi:hypothetical protein